MQGLKKAMYLMLVPAGGGQGGATDNINAFYKTFIFH